MPPNKLADRRSKNTELAQLSFIAPLYHIEKAIEREYGLLSPYERKRVGELLRNARDHIRYANEILGPLHAKRNKPHAIR